MILLINFIYLFISCRTLLKPQFPCCYYLRKFSIVSLLQSLKVLILYCHLGAIISKNHLLSMLCQNNVSYQNLQQVTTHQIQFYNARYVNTEKIRFGENYINTPQLLLNLFETAGRCLLSFFFFFTLAMSVCKSLKRVTRKPGKFSQYFFQKIREI